MKAMVLINLATDAHLTNRSRGLVEDIILDPREDLDQAKSAMLISDLSALSGSYGLRDYGP
jgi:hypothetical protein